MDRIAFLNGAFVPLAEASVPVMDRGFLFADGVYEVSAVVDGALVDNAAHLARLDRSLREIEIANPYSAADWEAHQVELVRRNALREGVIYLQVTRGVAERDFPFPPAGSAPTVVMFTQAKRILDNPMATTGGTAVTVPDIRWVRRDIKSVALLAQVLAKQVAAASGATEALMVEDGLVTEGSSSSVMIITKAGVIVTRPLSTSILPGITRAAVLKLAAAHGLATEERAFSVAEALDAAEVFITSASSFVMPIVAIDGTAIGDGRPGRHATALRSFYIDMARGGSA